VWDAVVQAYLTHLTAAGDWATAAQLLPRLLKDRVAQWERWVMEFGQVGGWVGGGAVVLPRRCSAIAVYLCF